MTACAPDCWHSSSSPTTAVVVVPAVVAPDVVAGATAKAGGGCGKAATPGVTTEQLTVDGRPRDYLLSIPDSYDPSTRAPLIFNFHGLGSNKEQQALYSGMNQKAGAAGYVVITPDGTGTDLRHWAFPPLAGSATDVAFVKALLATTTRALCIDPKRVYATGMSNGAIFSTALACALPGRFAAIAPVAGVNGTKVCGRGTPPTSVLAFHGTADPIVPYAGGRYFAGANPLDETPSRAGAARAQPVDDAVAAWAAFDGCGTPRDHRGGRGHRARRVPGLPGRRDRRALPGGRRRPHVAGFVPDQPGTTGRDDLGDRRHRPDARLLRRPPPHGLSARARPAQPSFKPRSGSRREAGVFRTVQHEAEACGC